MDRAYLEEYEAREIEEIRQFMVRRKNNILTDGETYPPQSRFHNLRCPCTRAIQHPNVAIWPQIPLTGSLVLKLAPIKKNIFGDYHSFELDDIPAMIQFAKETGRIQFVLQEKPTMYIGLDHLQPVFEELQPPYDCEPVEFLDKKALDLGQVEFDTVADLGYYRCLSKKYYCEVLGEPFMQSYVEGDRDAFATLRSLGFHDIADAVIENLLIDTELAQEIIDLSRILLLNPLLDSMNAIPSFYPGHFERFGEVQTRLGGSFTFAGQYPCEIGSYLMKALTYYPESFEACKMVIAQYDENDLYRVYEALNEAIWSSDVDSIVMSKEDMSEILENAWSESKKIRRRAGSMEFGLNFTVGLVGLAVGGTPGLLATLGLEVLDRLSSKFMARFGELISRKVAHPYSVSIHDFKKKYGIGD